MARRSLGVFLVLAIGCAPIDEPSVDPKEDGDVIDAPRIPEGFASGVNFAPPTNQRTGLVQLDGNSLVDDQGKFNALGATMMWAAWGYKFDRARLEENLAFLSEHGFHYIRALGVVGDYVEADHWDGREIDWHWPDYAEVIAGLTDLAYDSYGMRVEWTLIGDGQKNIPESADRYALVDTFIAMSEGREQKIIHFEIANEAWQNGFDGSEGLSELRALSQYMKERTPILVAPSAPAGQECADRLAVYEGDVADIATIHFDRDLSMVDGPWRPVRQPWDHVYCEPALPVGSNNEPIGPGASVASEEEPVRLVAGAITTFVSNLPLHVFHSSAGVRGDTDLWEMSGADAFVHVNDIVPADIASWTRKNAHWPDAPFRVYAEENGQLVPDAMWPDLGAATAGAVRAYGSVNGNDFFVFPIGILDHLRIEARQNMAFDVIDPMTGEVISSHVLAAGEQIELAGHEALALAGAFR